MTIYRNSLAQWENYLTNNVSSEHHRINLSALKLPNGPYGSLDEAKYDASGILQLYLSVSKSALYDDCVLKLSPDNNALIIENLRKVLNDGHRPIAEAGADLNTLDVEFNILKYIKDIKTHEKSNLVTGNEGVKPYSDSDTYDDDKSRRTSLAIESGHQDNTNRYDEMLNNFFTSVGTTNEYENFENSFIALRKEISDPSSNSIRHYLNHLHLTFVFQIVSDTPSVQQERIQSYETYLDSTFSTNPQEYHDDVLYSCHIREPYHLVDNYYAITISRNMSTSTNSVMMHINFINNFSNFQFDWTEYPGNLYVGNVCKILT